MTPHDTPAIDAAALAGLQAWQGRSESLRDQIVASPVRALSATLDRDDPAPTAGTPLPAPKAQSCRALHSQSCRALPCRKTNRHRACLRRFLRLHNLVFGFSLFFHIGLHYFFLRILQIRNIFVPLLHKQRDWHIWVALLIGWGTVHMIPTRYLQP